ncbi:hypothetical protein CTEN210_11791 [Chaetoceros tenuissimus]|uniref:Uncharacterized protein n=1 Tax=Chaetoceros tenuissimus TaxID=426638 RepID=A0AAD3D2G2_9STRA|nr:hypothetical protein CTEN210_11791 [Chaetoceros tenuissimus]
MSTSPSAAPSIPPTSTPDSKILSDLATVIEKINLCTSMLYPLTSTYEIDQDESLLTIIGFLEACCPRVRELIEAGMTGALQEDTVVKCLTVNDLLLQVLEFVEHPETCNQKEEVKEDKKVEAVVDDFDAFGIMDEDDLLDDFDSKPAAASSSVEETAKAEKTTTNHLDDLLLAPVPEPVSNTTSTSADTTKPKEDTTTDDFDDFFNSRVSPQQS